MLAQRLWMESVRELTELGERRTKLLLGAAELLQQLRARSRMGAGQLEHLLEDEEPSLGAVVKPPFQSSPLRRSGSNKAAS